ncbi:hypothetical protein [uncultured Brevibacillus sp.]|uniref:hypothetical protein n=1 Tax=uncultured Brevibacillus sp. TaxID=169970 RepID=UPI002593ACB7|nr:hypothetical protein [uncultured Brevibacillus sp.]
MSEPLLDFPEHVELTEPIRQREQELLVFDVSDDALDSEIKKLMLELEDITDATASELQSDLESICDFKDENFDKCCSSKARANDRCSFMRQVFSKKIKDPAVQR